MATRYVFWRMPNGKSYRGTDGKHAPCALLAEIGNAATINAEGAIQWSNFSLFRLQPSLRLATVVIGPECDELNDTDASSIVWPSVLSGIRRRGGSSPVLPADVISEANARAAAHFRKPLISYALVGSLSLQSFPARRLHIRGCEIAPLASRRRFSYPDYLTREADRTAYGEHVRSTKYQLIRVKTSGRTIHEASRKAMDSIAMLQGLWNLLATCGSWTFGGGSLAQRPLGVIHRGPIYTLHHPGGRLAENVYWYEPDYVLDQSLFAPSGGWHHLERQRRWTATRIAKSPFRTDLEELLIRYAAALGNADLNTAFLDLWSILEKATNTVDANYDSTVERAAWPFRDRAVAINVMESLRCCRNRLVHAARSGEERDQVAYLLKSFVDDHLLRLIRNDFAAESLEEYGKYLALPTDLKMLEKRRRQLVRTIGKLRKWSGNGVWPTSAK